MQFSFYFKMIVVFLWFRCLYLQEFTFFLVRVLSLNEQLREEKYFAKPLKLISFSIMVTNINFNKQFIKVKIKICGGHISWITPNVLNVLTPVCAWGIGFLIEFLDLNRFAQSKMKFNDYFKSSVNSWCVLCWVFTICFIKF